MTLGEYVQALIERLGESDPEALVRMRRVTVGRRARIVLDDEAVDVAFGPERLTVEPARAGARVDGEGVTDRQTVLDLLDAYLEVTAAIREGRLRVRGDADDIARMFIALEILLDASARTPSLQALAVAFRNDHDAGRAPRPRRRPTAVARAADVIAAEHALLARLDLLPDRLDEPGRAEDHSRQPGGPP